MSLLFNSYGKVNTGMCSSQLILTKVILAKHPNLDADRASMLLNLGFSASLAKLKGSKWRKKSANMLTAKEVRVQMTKRRPISRQDLEAPRYRRRSQASYESSSSLSRKSPKKSTPVKTAKRTVAKKIGRSIQRRESLTKDFMLKIASTRLRALAAPAKQPLTRE